MTIAIKVENLSKVYAISHKGDARSTLRETIENSIRNVTRRLSAHANSATPHAEGKKQDTVEEFKALEGVSFEVAQGERLAVIGQNGAGKSTLLKILSHVTEPTGGRITIKGRVSSLLEVGTGFHPELSGRENVYLNGAVLGMPKSEIRRKFDEIVAFSEIENFLDTPVKYYSSGMYVRLAFSVAAHLDPDVLILDEVLAVGDVRFQQKCLERMQYASKEGRTVLFVSHNMQSVMQICPQAVLLRAGRVEAAGLSADVIKAYMGSAFLSSSDAGDDRYAHYQGTSDDGDKSARLVEARLKNQKGEITSTLLFHEKNYIEMDYEIKQHDGEYFVPNFHIYNAEGTMLGILAPKNETAGEYGSGKYTAICELPRHLLNEGVFRVMAALSSWKGAVKIHYAVSNALTFKMVDDLTDASFRNGYMSALPGLIRPGLNWSIKKS
jgi:lipopolysaccharide transport system ATP-binding protein